MSTTMNPAWPTQIHLPGQTAAPEGPVDMFMMYVMHHAFRRDLAKLTEAAQHTPAGDRVAWRLLQQRWGVFAEALHGHHSGEDAGLWPLLLDRGSEEDCETLEAMEADGWRIALGKWTVGGDDAEPRPIGVYDATVPA